MMNICGKDIKVEGRLIRIGGPHEDKYNCPDDPEAMINALRSCGQRIDLFTFLQRLPETSPKYAYPMEWDNLAVLPITTFDHWWKHQLHSHARNRARQAQKKGVTFREVPFGDVLLRGICEIYNESPVRLGKPFRFYGMTLESAHKYAGTFLDRSTYIGAFLGETMIGFTKLVTDEARTIACMVHILGMVRHRDRAVTNALIGEAVQFCAARGISFLVYEKFAYGRKLEDGLSHFKAVNGFQRVYLPRYYVPLTPLGSAAFHLGLHHRFVECIPECIAGNLRKLRKAWYDRKFRLSTEDS